MAPIHWKKPGKKTMYAVIGGVLLLGIVIISVALGLPRQSDGDTPTPSQTVDISHSSAPEESKDPDEAQTEGQPSISDDGFIWQDAPNLGHGEQNGVEQNGSQRVTFPYTIGDTGLTVQKLGSYDGVYIEDGSDTNVSNVCIVMLENTQDTVVEYVKVSVELNGKMLTFEASAIPPKSTVVVQESGKSSWVVEGECTSCTAEVARLDEFELSEDQVKVVDNGDGSLTVTNLTDQEIPAVRLFYKFYMSDEDVYVGGIAYTAKITELAGKASVTVTPSHYVSGSAKVLMVRTYDEP